MSFFTGYIWTDSDQPRLENLLMLLVCDCDCGWFDEKYSMFYDVTYGIVVVV
jgi:hypothetical protein